jgi:serine/threonine protein kinase
MYEFLRQLSLLPAEVRQRFIASYKLGGKLGSGTFGIVYEGEDLRTGLKVAVKEHKSIVDWSVVAHEISL